MLVLQSNHKKSNAPPQTLDFSVTTSAISSDISLLNKTNPLRFAEACYTKFIVSGALSGQKFSFGKYEFDFSS